MGRIGKILKKIAIQERIEIEKLISVAHKFMRDNISLLLDCYKYDYSGDLHDFEEFDREYEISVKSFTEQIAPGFEFENKFKAHQGLVEAFSKLEIEKKYFDTFLCYLEDSLDENDYFTRLQLRLELKKAYPEGKIVEMKNTGHANFGMYVVFPGNDDYPDDKEVGYDRWNFTNDNFGDNL